MDIDIKIPIADRIRTVALVHKRIMRCLTWPAGSVLARDIILRERFPKVAIEASLHRDFAKGASL
jgi:hypothetical protein